MMMTPAERVAAYQNQIVTLGGDALDALAGRPAFQRDDHGLLQRSIPVTFDDIARQIGGIEAAMTLARMGVTHH